ncbi:BlaI/MecI/CopY family transcriptional regulator [candidate division KSB1 bacterium]|nr:BlaI/MecI/CopY family transcriptional regulator [candidate division KSB1 bacterium]
MLPKISEAEWRVMKLLWDKSPRTANDIVDALEGSVDWNAQTIRTLINRLVQKGAINFEKDGRAYLYNAKVKEREVQRAETRSFVSRVFNGAMKPMIAAFLEETELSEAEIDELERLLREKKSKN